jgi:hypothetical protein
VASAVALFIISTAMASWTTGGQNEPKQFLKSLTVTSSTAVLTGVTAAVVYGAAALFAVAVTVGVFVVGTRLLTEFQQRRSTPDPEPATIEQ